MKINKKLLPIKAQFFFSNAGAAPIVPFIPIIVKELGFSSVALGWIYTAYPVLTIFMKPMFGSIADKLKRQKSLLLILLIIHAIACYSVKWVPPLPTTNSVILNCDEDLVVKTCSEKLKEECFANNILGIFNTTNTCKIRLRHEHKVHENDVTKQSLLKDTLVVTEYFEDFSVLLDYGSIQGSCLSIYLKNESHLFSKWSSACASRSTTPELFCDSTSLSELLKKPAIEEQDVTLTYQFWMLFTIIICIRVSMSIAISLVDTICFAFLGDRPEDYGKQRMWGAIGWGLISIISGFIVDYMSKGKDKKDYSTSFYIMMLFFTIHFFIIASINVNQKNKSKSIMKDVKNLFKNSKICIFIVWCIISGIYVAFVWNFLFWFIEDLASKSGCINNSYIKTLEGLVLTVQTYCGEIPFFFLSGRILKKIGHENAMTLVLFTFGLRFLLYSSLTNPWWILPVECLNGITFGIFYATMTTYASVISPPGTEATVQNLVTAIFEGVGTALGGLLGGYLFKALGSSQTFLVIGSSAIAFGFLHLLAQKMTKDVKSEFYKSVGMRKTENETENDDDKGRYHPEITESGKSEPL